MTRKEKVEKCVEKEVEYLLARYGDPEHVEDLMPEVWAEFEEMSDEDLDERLRR